MATLTSKYSLVEQVKRINPDGTQAKIVEVLDREMGMLLQEAPWMASNDVYVNKTVRRATLPSGERRKLNRGVGTGVTRTTEIMDVIEMMGIYAEYDKDWINGFPDPALARWQEAQAFLEGLGQSLLSDILYCNSNADPDGMHGLAPRLATVDSEYILNSGGSGSDVTSIYVVTWGPTEVFLAYPKNSPNFGIEHQNLGEVTLEEYDSAGASTGRKYQGYRDYFQVKCGLVVRNPRCVGRIANIESSGSSNTFNNNDLVTLLNNMKTNASTRIYMNQTVKTQAEILMLDKSNIYWTPDKGLDGQEFIKFRNIPVRMIDKDILLNTEDAIS